MVWGWIVFWKTELGFWFPSRIMVVMSLFVISSFWSVSLNGPARVVCGSMPSPALTHEDKSGYLVVRGQADTTGVRNLLQALDSKRFPCLAFHKYNLLMALVRTWFSFSFYSKLKQLIILHFQRTEFPGLESAHIFMYTHNLSIFSGS